MSTIFIKESTVLPERRPMDYYPTPVEVARDALTYLPDKFPVLRIVDAGAGEGIWGQAAREKWPNAWITGIEKRDVLATDDYDRWETGDYLKTSIPHIFCVIGNPPYKLAEPFVRHSLSIMEPGGYLIFLLRLVFLESKKRGEGLFKEYPLQTCVVRANRVSFTGDGKTNADAFAYFVWQKGWTGETSLKWSLHK